MSSAPQQVPLLVTALSSPHSERGERAAIAALYSQLIYEACGGHTEVSMSFFRKLNEKTIALFKKRKN